MAISKILYMRDTGSGFHGRHLKTALDYIMNPEKTQEGRLVGAVNCQPDNAFEQMKATKRKFGKIDKRQGYHLILSFKEDETNPDMVFEITRRFVEEYLGKSFEAVFCVHDNTDHVHSHIVFNSVSFLDGKKYRYEKGDWAKDIQPITNRLCEELEKTKAAQVGAEDAPAYVKEMMEQMAASIEKIQYQEQRYDELNQKLTIFESTKRDEEVRDNLLQKYNDAESLLNSQQNKLNQADSTIARLREQNTDKEKEMKRMQTRIDTLEDKLLARADMPERETPVVSKNAIAESESEDAAVNEEKHVTGNSTVPIPDMFTGNTAIPVYYQMPVVDAQGRIVQRVPVERNLRKSETGVAALIGKLGFKKKSRQDIVKLVAAGNLVPAQLIQIKSGIERGLTEGQLVELINNNVSAEKMKEIIEIAVLENSMDY